MKQIENFPYFIDINGRVWSDRSKKYLKESIDFQGYKRVGLFINKTIKSKRIHRLVAISFIPNHENKPQINHINGIKTDNRIENLEWVTPSENQIHAFNNNLNKISTEQKAEVSNRNKLMKRDGNGFARKIIIDVKSNIIYNSISEAAIALQIDTSYLGKMLNGKRKNKTTLKFY